MVVPSPASAIRRPRPLGLSGGGSVYRAIRSDTLHLPRSRAIRRLRSRRESSRTIHRCSSTGPVRPLRVPHGAGVQPRQPPEPRQSSQRRRHSKEGERDAPGGPPPRLCPSYLNKCGTNLDVFPVTQESSSRIPMPAASWPTIQRPRMGRLPPKLGIGASCWKT
jgi:hypothetical protein